jgi:hypothetical protein
VVDKTGLAAEFIDRADDAALDAPGHDPSKPSWSRTNRSVDIRCTDRPCRNQWSRKMLLEWSFTYFLIQAFAGFLGAHLAALVAREYGFGHLRHGLVGLVTGALSGFFLQRPVLTIVTAAGDVMPITKLQALVSQAATGLAVGGIAMLAVGFLRTEMAEESADD